MNLKKQLHTLLALEFFGNFRLAGGVWVLLLVSRGFSLVQVGLAESFFHVVSFCCEIPSGMLSDVLGRRRTMIASQAMFAVSAAAMLLSNSMPGVCLAMGLNALAYNLLSGTREAVTYDSLLLADRAGDYLRFSSLQNVLWRCAAALSSLCAGAAVWLGYRRGYGADLCLSLLAAALACRLVEPVVTRAQRERGRSRLSALPGLLASCAGESARFLRDHPGAVGLMLFNGLIGACATLLRFFLQDGLAQAGAPAALLGPMLLVIELGGVAGARLALPLARLPYWAAGALCTAVVALSLLGPLTGCLPLLVVSGALAAAGDDALQTLTDARLNAVLPSDQRATLISVDSMLFSLLMIVLSPLAGALAGGL